MNAKIFWFENTLLRTTVDRRRGVKCSHIQYQQHLLCEISRFYENRHRSKVFLCNKSRRRAYVLLVSENLGEKFIREPEKSILQLV